MDLALKCLMKELIWIQQCPLAKKCSLDKKTSELNWPVYFNNELTSEWKPGNVALCKRVLTLVSIGEEKLWIPSKLIKLS